MSTNKRYNTRQARRQCDASINQQLDIEITTATKPKTNRKRQVPQNIESTILPNFQNQAKNLKAIIPFKKSNVLTYTLPQYEDDDERNEPSDDETDPSSEEDDETIDSFSEDEVTEIDIISDTNNNSSNSEEEEDDYDDVNVSYSDQTIPYTLPLTYNNEYKPSRQVVKPILKKSNNKSIEWSYEPKPTKQGKIEYGLKNILNEQMVTYRLTK
jgi:hypothetical protein